jgi:hypothetical protein
MKTKLRSEKIRLVAAFTILAVYVGSMLAGLIVHLLKH